MKDETIIHNQQEFIDATMADKHHGAQECVTIDHFKAAIVLRRFIQLTPMDNWCKKVMSMRIGEPWNGIPAKSHMAIALELGCLESEVIEIEDTGKKLVGDYIMRVTAPGFNKTKQEDIGVSQVIIK